MPDKYTLWDRVKKQIADRCRALGIRLSFRTADVCPMCGFDGSKDVEAAKKLMTKRIL